MKPRFSARRIFVSLVMVMSVPAAQATTLYWDLNGTTANTVVAVTGAWNGTNTFWNTNSTGTGGAAQAATTAADDLVLFSGTSYTTGTITASASRVASSISFEDNIIMTVAGPVAIGGTGTKSGIFVLSSDNAASTVSGALTLAAASTIQNAGTGVLSITGGITGAQNLTLQNNGVTANGVTVSTGSLNNGGSITNSGTGTGNTLISSVIGTSVTGGITQNSSTSGLTLSGANTFTGPTTITSGNLTLTTSTTALTTTSGVTVSPGGSLILNAVSQTFASPKTLSISGTGAGGNGALQTSGAAATLTWNGPISLAGDSFIRPNGNGTFTFGGTIALGAFNLTFNPDGSQTNAFSGVISGSGGIIKGSTATLALSGASTAFSGGVTVNSGTVVTSVSASALGTGTVLLGDTTGSVGATLNTGATALTFANNINVRSGSTGTKTLGHTGTLGVSYSGGVALNGNLTINSTSSGRLTLTGVMSGAGALTVSGSGTGDYVPAGLNTYGGGTTLNAGSFTPVSTNSAGPAGAPTTGCFGTGTLTLAGGQMRSGTGGPFTVGNVVTLSGDTTFYTIASEKSLIFSGPATITGATRTLTSTVGTTVAGSSAIFNGDIGDGGNTLGLTKAGLGNLTLNGNNTYGGNTTINAGVLSIGSTSSLPGWNVNGRYSVASGATLAVQNGVADADVITMLGTTNFAAGAVLGFDTAAGNRTFALNLTNTSQGQLDVVKLGANTLTLSGTNTYSGTTTVSAGSLLIPSIAALPGWDTSGRYSIASTGTLVIPNTVSEAEVTTMLGTSNFAIGATLAFDTSAGNRSYTSVVSNSATGSINLTKIGANSLTFNGNNTYTGTTTVSAGTLVAGGSVSSTTGNIVVADGTTNAVLNVPLGGTLTGGTLTAGKIAGSNGAVNISGGSVTMATPETTDAISFGGGEGAYGAFTMSSGSFTQQRFMFGGIGTSTTLGGMGVGLVSGGTVNSSGWIILARAGASTGVLTITGGTINHANAAQALSIGLQGSGRAELNVAGGLIDNTGQRVTFSGGTTGGFHWTGTGLLNLNAGTLLTNSVAYDTNAASANASSYVNFNGGTLKSSSSTAAFLNAFTPTGTGINRVFVNGAFGSFAGGAVIDTNGFDDTISANLLAPTGSGLATLPVLTEGSGYIGAPYVSVSGTGRGATAIANMVDDGSGNGTLKVGSVTITNPGVDYTGTPTFTFTGGGPGTPATADTATIAANTSGGLTKAGAGTLTLTGANDYTGLTSVTAGILTVGGAGTLSGTVGLSVAAAAQFNYLPTSPGTLTLGTSGTLALASGSFVGTTFGSTINAPGAASVSGAVNLVPSGTFVTGTPYTLLTAASGLDGATYNVLNPTSYTFAQSVSATSVQITPTTATPLSSAYWLGGFSGYTGVWAVSNGSSSSNWTTDGAGTGTSLVPGAGANIIFSDAGASGGNQLNMSLGADMAINGMTVNSPNPLSLLKVGPYALTVGSGGILVNPGAGAVTLNPNIIVSGAQTWDNSSSNTLTLGGTVSNGTTLLTIAGSGATSLATLTSGTGGIAVSNGGAVGITTFTSGTGGLSVSAGTTTITAATLTGAQTWTNNSANLFTAGSIANGGFALTLGGTGNSAVNGVLSGTGGLIKTGAGTATLSAANTYTGATVLSGGTLTLTGNRTTAPGAWTAGSAGNAVILNLQGDLPVLTGNNFIGNGAGGSTVVNQTSGNVSFGAATILYFGSGGVSGNVNTSTYNLSGGTLGGATSTGIVSLGVNGYSNNTFNLTGSGILTLPAGALHIGRTGRSDVSNVNNIFNQTGGGSVATVSSLIVGGDNNTAVTAAAVNGTLNVSAGSFSAAAFPSFAAGNTNNSSINISGGALVTLPAFPTVRGTGSTATLTFDGGTLLPVAASPAYISGVISVLIKSNGATFDVASGKDITVSPALLTDGVSLGGGLTKLGSGSLTLTGANTYTGQTTITGGTLQLGSASTTGTLALGSAIVDNGTFSISRTNAVAQGTDFSASPVTGSGGFTQAGAGTTTLNALNSFTGPATLTAGTLSVAAIGNIGVASPIGAGDATSAASNTASLVFNGGTLAYTSATGTTDRGFTVNATSVFTLTGSGTNTFTFAGKVTGSGQLTFGGLNTTGIQNLVTLSGDNSAFTGNIPIAVGGVRATNSNSLGSGAKTITMTNGTNGNPRIELDGTAGNITLPTFTYVVSNQTQNGCFVNIAGNNTIPGQINITSGGGGLMASSFAGNLNITANITAVTTGRGAFFQGASSGTASGNISDGLSPGTFFLQKSGAGTWTLSGANTYMGATTIGEGTLSVASLNSVTGGASSSSLGAPVSTVNGTIALGGGSVLAPAPASTGTLLYTGSGETTDRVLNLVGTTGGGGIDQSGTGLLKFTSALTATGAGSKTLTLQGSTAGTGEISGAIVNNSGTNTTSVEKKGSGTWTLSGANTYTGSTTVTGGTLSLTSAYLADTSSLTVASGATLNLNYVGTDTVTSLTLGGVTYLAGTFDSGTSPGLISGTGKIKVGIGYSGWADSNGIPGQPATDDFDKDGLTNLVEYALGLNPTTPNGAPGTFSGGVLTFTKGAEAIANGDVNYYIEESTDLGATDPWSPAVTQTAPNASPTISYTLPTGQPKEFARLRVTLQ